MGLVLVCPQCQAGVELAAAKCPFCQADLRNLAKDQRRYRIGQPGPLQPTAAAAPEVVAAESPAAAVPAPVPTGRVRRPYIRRYAGQPVAATHPSTLTEAAAPAASAPPSGRIRRPYIRRYAGEPVAVTHPTTLSKPAATSGKAEAKKTKKTKTTAKKKK